MYRSLQRARTNSVVENFDSVERHFGVVESRVIESSPTAAAAAFLKVPKLALSFSSWCKQSRRGPSEILVTREVRRFASFLAARVVQLITSAIGRAA